MAKFPDGQVFVVISQLGVQDLMEAVHMQLANKRRHIAVLEVVQKRISKLFTWIKSKRIGIVGPSPPDEMG